MSSRCNTRGNALAVLFVGAVVLGWVAMVSAAYLLTHPRKDSQCNS